MDGKNWATVRFVSMAVLKVKTTGSVGETPLVPVGGTTETIVVWAAAGSRLVSTRAAAAQAATRRGRLTRRKTAWQGSRTRISFGISLVWLLSPTLSAIDTAKTSRKRKRIRTREFVESERKIDELKRRRVNRRRRGGGRRRRCFRLARVPGAFGARQRAENDVQVAVAQHLRRRIRLAVSGSFFDKFVHHGKAKFLVRTLASAKAQFDPDFHVFAQEFDGVTQLDREIVGINSGSELELLHFVCGLAAVRFLAPLGFLVHEFAVLHDPAHGRRGVGRDLDQVQTLALGQTNGFTERHDAELLFGIVDNPDFAGANLPVSTMLRFAGLKGSKRAAQSAPGSWSLVMGF